MTGDYSQQSAQERKRDAQKARLELREGFRRLAGEAADNENSRATRSVAALTRVVGDSGQLFTQVIRPQEAGLDSKVLISTSATAAALARDMKNDRLAFDRLEFADKVAELLRKKRPREMEDEDDDDDRRGGLPDADWSRLGWMAARYTKRVCIPDFALGPLAIEHKVRTTVRKAKQKKMPKTRPEDVQQVASAKAVDGTLDSTFSLEDTLEKITTDTDGQAINFYEFVINPFSYSQTIENLFYLSFVIKKSHAALMIDEDTGLLMIMASEPASKDVIEETNLSKMQMMLEMDMDIWQDAIDTFGITECMHIPNRVKLHD